MNILLINHYAGSPNAGMEFRPYYLSREWIKRGHKVLIIGASYSHLRKQQPNCKNEVIDDISYSWIKTNKYTGNGIGRIISMCFFVSKLQFLYKKYISNFIPDVVIASSTYPLDIYPSLKIAKHFNAKLIYEVHDLWPLSPIELGGYSKKHPFIRIIQNAENYAYKHVDAVISILPKAETHMLRHGLKKGKFFHVPNGVVLSDWEYPQEIPEEHSSTLERLKTEGWFIMGFTGAHGIANSLESIIDAVAGLESEKVALVLVGSGQEKNNLIEHANNKNTNNIYFLPPVSKLSVPNILDKMDLLYIGLQKQSLFRFGISPNKLFDYMMSAKPIIQAIEAGNDLVTEAECGISVEPENVSKIANAIIQLKKMPPEKRAKLGINGRNYVLKHNTYNVLSEKFLGVLNNLIKK